MLPKKYRLKKSGDIRGILKSGRTHREGFLILKIRENNLSNSRFAFLISLKISKKATVRNKLKRKLSKFIRINLSEIKNNIDAVLIVASDFSKKSRGIWIMMPAPSPVSLSPPVAPRCNKLQSTSIPSRTISCDLTALRLTTNPTPQLPRSRPGSQSVFGKCLFDVFNYPRLPETQNECIVVHRRDW